MSLLEARNSYKPFEYPWAYDFWKRQQQIHWLPEEVPLGEDCRDWAQKLSDHERNLLTQIFRFFTQADIEVQNCYHENYGRVFKPTEVKMMLTAFSNMETVHVAAYSHLLDTIGMPESEYSAFLEYEEMAAKVDYIHQFGVDSDEDIARTLAMFGGFTEGLQLFASFAMLMNFPRFNKMKGMGQIVSWSVRDESLHCEGITKLFHAFCAERGCLTKSVKEDIIDCCQKVVRLEDAFIDLAFEMGPVPGMTAKEIKRYIRYIADWRLGQLGLPAIYMVEDHPLPWLAPLLNGVEHANFFETRATEYSKASTRGEWGQVWSSFDNRKKKIIGIEPAAEVGDTHFDQADADQDAPRRAEPQRGSFLAHLVGILDVEQGRTDARRQRAEADEQPHHDVEQRHEQGDLDADEICQRTAVVDAFGSELAEEIPAYPAYDRQTGDFPPARPERLRLTFDHRHSSGSHSSMNRSGTVTANSFAMRSARGSEGSYLSVSTALIVWRETPRRRASSPWLQPFASR